MILELCIVDDTALRRRSIPLVEKEHSHGYSSVEDWTDMLRMCRQDANSPGTEKPRLSIQFRRVGSGCGFCNQIRSKIATYEKFGTK